MPPPTSPLAKSHPAVTVIGGGMAGVYAAFRLAQAGARVTICSHKPGASALSSGAFDLAPSFGLPAPPSWSDRPALAENLAHLAAATSAHPLHGIANLDAVLAQTLAALRSLLPGHDVIGGPENPNLILPSTAGTFKETAAAPAALARGDLVALAGQETAIIGFASTPGFSAPRIAAALREVLVRHAGETAPGVQAVTVRDTGLPWLDDPVHGHLLKMKADAGPETVAAVAETVARACAGCALVWLGPGLSLAAIEAVHRHLEPHGIRAAGLLAPPPGGHGAELLAAAWAQAKTVGVTSLEGHVSQVVTGPGSRVIAVKTSTDSLTTDFYLLASGGFLGGGLGNAREGGGRLAEMLFQAPVWCGPGEPAPVDVTDLTSLSLHDNHRLLLSGVRCDARWRPVGLSGRPVFANLFACGRVIGGFDFAQTRSGLLTALLTAELAAQAIINDG